MKRDSSDFFHIIDELKDLPILGESNKWWPRYLFHFTDLQNALSIIENEQLLSRVQAQESGLMENDNACSNVIDHTNEQILNSVRLYFRPRTPTQYQNEGFRPRRQQYGDAHCPVPVFFLFDSKAILTMDNTRFSMTGLNKSVVRTYSSAADFRKMPFDKIYHDKWFPMEQRDEIVSARHAEVIIPDRLDLTSLKLIMCRSNAEYRSLLYQLSDYARRKWLPKIGTGTKGNLFHRHWLFINDVNMDNNEIVVNFNIPSDTITPFLLRVIFCEHTTGKTYTYEDSEFGTDDDYKLEMDISNISHTDDYDIRIFFDDCLVFADEFVNTQVPF